MSLQWAQTELKNNVDKRERKNKDCIVFKFDVETVGVRVCVCLVWLWSFVPVQLLDVTEYHLHPR